MDTPLPFDNAIAWANFRLRGGARNLLAVTTGYGVILGGLIFLSLRSNIEDWGLVLSGWTYILMALQAALLLMMAGHGIRTAIRRDQTTLMIESHRLMPVSGASAMLGYVLGNISQAACLGLVNVAVGVPVCAGAGYWVGDWLLANLILWLFAMFSWVLLAAFSTFGNLAFGALIASLVLSTMTGGIVLMLFPGLQVLVSPMIGQTIFGIMERSGTFNWVYTVSTMVQAAVAGLFLLAAIRKYERDERVAFTPIMGLLLVGLWAAVSMVGIAYYEDFSIKGVFPDRPPPEAQLIAAMAVTLVVALVPLMSALRLADEWTVRQQLNDPALPRRPVPVLAVIVVSPLLLLILPLQLAPAGRDPAMSLLYTAVVSAVFLVSTWQVLRLLGRITQRITLPLGVWIFLTWVLPFVLDGLRFASDNFRGEPVTSISGASPLGAFILLWGDAKDPVLFGVLFQVGLAVVMGVLAKGFRRPHTPVAIAAADAARIGTGSPAADGNEVSPSH